MAKGLLIAKDIWRSHPRYLGNQSIGFQQDQLVRRIADTFCPGPYFCYVIDSPTLTLDHISESIQPILGIPLHQADLQQLIDTIHPEDLDFFLRCEDVVAHFLQHIVSADKVCDYKIVSSLRHIRRDGTPVTLLKQTLVMNATDEGSLLKVLGVHADISHITRQPPRTLSFVGLNGEPSYMELDVFGENVFDSFNPYRYTIEEVHYTARELEIIRLLARGNSSAEIACALNISEQTVQTHRKNILKKSPVRNTTELIEFCIRRCYL